MVIKHQYIVLPFRLARGKFAQAEARNASSEARALEMAERAVGRFDGAAAIAVEIDELGEGHDPRLLGVFGKTPPMELAL